MNSNTTDTTTPFLKHGSWWVEYEDCIVGTEDGLKKLRDACDEALSSGDFYSNELDDFHGVIKVTEEWASNPEFPPPPLSDKLLGLFIMSTLGGSLVVGVIVILRWIWSLISFCC